MLEYKMAAAFTVIWSIDFCCVSEFVCVDFGQSRRMMFSVGCLAAFLLGSSHYTSIYTGQFVLPVPLPGLQLGPGAAGERFEQGDGCVASLEDIVYADVFVTS
tara:strand:- start:374 stop:682 length:309 start_codon:yes stop_codon:yes gene_type:complete